MSATPAFASADPALFNPQSGRLDASHIASDIQLPVSTIAVAIGKKAPSVRKHPDASSLNFAAFTASGWQSWNFMRVARNAHASF